MQNCPYFNKKHINSLVSEKVLNTSSEGSLWKASPPAQILRIFIPVGCSTWISCFLKVYFAKRILKCLCLIYTYWKRTLLGKRSYIMTITDENRSTLFIWRIAWSNGKKTLQEIKSESGDLYPIKLDTGFYHKVTFSLTLLSRISPS